MNWKIHVCGTRGSFPHPGKEYIEYGGNTSCFYVDCGEHLILDAGSGMSSIQEIYQDQKPVHILLSHVHMDHIIGLFQCKFFFQKKREVHIYGEERNGKNIEEQLRQVITKPYWPVDFDDYSADIHFHSIQEDESFNIQTIKISTKRSFHPNDSMIFRIEDDLNCLGYALDYETAMDHNDRIASFLHDCDLIIFDGNYIPGKEIAEYGHSTWKDGIQLRRKSHTDTVLLSHYAYQYTDEILKEQEALAYKEDEHCIFAKEGMVL